MNREIRTPYYSCYFVENSLIFHPFEIFHCCIPVRGKFGSTLIAKYKGGPLPLDKIRESREKYRNIITENSPEEHCHNCHYRDKKDWDSKYLFSNLHFNHSLLCNLNCSFCAQRCGPIEDKLPRYDVFPIVKQIVDSGLLNPESYIFWAGGEPTLLKDFEESFDLMMSYGITRNEIATNSTIFSEAIYKNLKSNGRLILKTSIDCGTPETFVDLKGKDLFFKVWENLGRYAETGGDVGAKYIITHRTISQKDLTGFVDMMKTTKISHAVVDLDHNLKPEQVTNDLIRAAAFLYYKLTSIGVNTRCGMHSTASAPNFKKDVENYNIKKLDI